MSRRFTQMDADACRLNELTEKIIGCEFRVGNGLGVGFLEKVYENALAHELRKTGLIVEQQKPVDVWYDGVIVGVYIADLFVEALVPIELKVAKAIDDIHLAQVLNQLKACKLSVGLLLNFGTSKVGVKRVVNNFNSAS
jgi:GxxExxY protein